MIMFFLFSVDIIKFKIYLDMIIKLFIELNEFN
jgi:hypothetical protein